MDHRAHICHLTVLNPAIHSRIFFKEARAQVKAGYQVTIIGQDPARAPYDRDGVRIIPTGVFHRLSQKRFTAPRKVLRLARETGADLFQIHTPELLKTGKTLKQEFPRCKLIYDVHEDYAANIKQGPGYPSWSRGAISSRVRKAENQFHEYGDGLVYAEDHYRDLLPMPADRIAFVGNKFARPKKDILAYQHRGLPYMVYSGTLSHPFGLGRTIELWNQLKEIEPLDLIIAGHTHDRSLLDEIRDWTGDDGDEGSVILIGGQDYLPHDELLQVIKGSIFGTALYEPLPHIREKVPTKFYEFMGLRRPLVFTDSPFWNDLNDRYDFGIPISYPFPVKVLECIHRDISDEHRTFFQSGMTDADWSWEHEKQALLDLCELVLRA